MSSPWAMPGASVPQPEKASPIDPPVSDTPSAVRGGVDRPLPPPPVPLRPMTIPDLLDGSFAILKRRPRDVLILSAVFVVPLQLFAALLFRDTLGASGFAGTGLGDPTAAVGFGESGELTGVGSFALGLLVGVVSLALLTGAIARLVADWYDGVQQRPTALILATLRRGPALVVGVIVVHALELIGLVGLLVGAYVAMALLQLVSPVIVAEDVGPMRAIARSVQLTGTKFWRSLGVPVLVGLIGAVVGFGFQLIPELVTLVVSDDWNWLIRSAGATLAQLIVAPFTAGVAVLYHLDLRTRSEAYDLARRVTDLGG